MRPTYLVVVALLVLGVSARAYSAELLPIHSLEEGKPTKAKIEKLLNGSVAIGRYLFQDGAVRRTGVRRTGSASVDGQEAWRSET